MYKFQGRIDIAVVFSCEHNCGKIPKIKEVKKERKKAWNCAALNGVENVKPWSWFGMIVTAPTPNSCLPPINMQSRESSAFKNYPVKSMAQLVHSGSVDIDLLQGPEFKSCDESLKKFLVALLMQ